MWLQQEVFEPVRKQSQRAWGGHCWLSTAWSTSSLVEGKYLIVLHLLLSLTCKPCTTYPPKHWFSHSSWSSPGPLSWGLLRNHACYPSLYRLEWGYQLLAVHSGPVAWLVRSLHFSLSCMMTYFIFSLLSPLVSLDLIWILFICNLILILILIHHHYCLSLSFALLWCSCSICIRFVRCAVGLCLFLLPFCQESPLEDDMDSSSLLTTLFWLDLSDCAIAFDSVNCCFVPWLIDSYRWMGAWCWGHSRCGGETLHEECCM